jgi:uncharacterized protein (DUF1499 family)
LRKLLLGAAAGAAAVAVGMALWVRLAPSDPADWHVDPITGPAGQGNAWRVAPQDAGPADGLAPVYGVQAAELARALDAHALGEPGTERLAGGPEALWTTYVQRSRWMKFPDYVSVRAVDLGGGRATVAIWSRARFGSNDMGVNRARVERWLGAVVPLAVGKVER